MFRLATPVLMLAAFASAAVAQDAPPPDHAARHAEMRERLMAADVNHDGKWSLDEWLAAGRKERGFRRLDTNNDGFVTMEELRAGMAARRAEHQARAAAQPPAPRAQ